MSNMNSEQGTWKKDLRLYVHVPFCVKKCDYCDFLSGPSDEKGIKAYFEALYKEIRSYQNRTDEYIVSSVFIGGGTPSCVDAEYIVRVLDALKEVFEFTGLAGDEPEITIEVNPGTIEMNSSGMKLNKLQAYKKAGINRLSFGLQSTHDHELKLLGRIHSYSQFEENYRLARELGFHNINIDMMSAIPGQNTEAWEANIHRVAALQPEHLSAYSLIIEEGTPFYERYGPEGPDRARIPSEETDRMIYNRTREILSSYGYERYEISNYAKRGYLCRHNLAYWEGTSYLGMGLGASSLIGNIRFNNIHSLQEYLNRMNENHLQNAHDNFSEKESKKIEQDFLGIRENVNSLTKNQQIEEFMFLGLRKTSGISKQDFLNRFDIPMDSIYKDVLDNLEKAKLIVTDKDRVRLTDYGIDVSNRVLAEFLF